MSSIVSPRLMNSLSSRRRLPSVVCATATSRRGVTLIELMIVLAVMGIVIGAAFPVIMGSLKNQDTFEAARGLASAIKQQRYRAQNLNRATAVIVSATDGKVYGYISTTSRCDAIVRDQGTVLYDVNQRNPDSKILATALSAVSYERMICIKPDGRVLDADTSLPFADAVKDSNDDLGGALRFEVGRADGVGRNHIIKLPFNGIARLE